MPDFPGPATASSAAKDVVVFSVAAAWELAFLCFQKRQRLVVAAALEKVIEMRINVARQSRLEGIDFFGHGLQAREVRAGVLLASLVICDHPKPLAERFRELPQEIIRFHWEKLRHLRVVVHSVVSLDVN